MVRSWIHRKLVHSRRVDVLARAISEMLPSGARVLDIGCGDGALVSRLQAQKKDLGIQGVEIAPRAACSIPATRFDGAHLPFPSAAFDFCLLVDVLHHAQAPLSLLREAARVAREGVIVKDHIAERTIDQWTLRFMDSVGNAGLDLPVPDRYWTKALWDDAFSSMGLMVRQTTVPDPYPWPASLVFGRQLHFVSLAGAEKQ